MAGDDTSSAPTDTMAWAAQLLKDKPDQTLVPLLIGALLDTGLCGVMLIQLYLWRKRVQESRPLRWVVRWCGTVTFAHTIYIWWSIIGMFGLNFGDYAAFFQFRYTLANGPFVLAVVPLIQLFYAERAYRLNGNCMWILVSLIPLILGAVAGEVGAMVMQLTASARNLKHAGEVFTIVFFGSFLASDLVVTVSMLVGLYKLRRRGGLGYEADDLIKRLLVIIVETQLPSTLLAVVTVIAAFVMPTSLFASAVSLMYSKVYFATFRAVLLGRRSLKERYTEPPSNPRPAQFAITVDEKYGPPPGAEMSLIEARPEELSGSTGILQTPLSNRTGRLHYTLGGASKGSTMAVQNFSMSSESSESPVR